MSGCLRTFCGHCIIILYIYINKNVVYNLYAAFFALVFKDDMVVISTAADIYNNVNAFLFIRKLICAVRCMNSFKIVMLFTCLQQRKSPHFKSSITLSKLFVAYIFGV